MHRGGNLVIRATGTVFETIEDGAYVNLVVKYGLIRLVNTKADLCEQVSNVDLECPIEKGILSITKAVEIPKEVPPVCLSSALFKCLSLHTTLGRSQGFIMYRWIDTNGYN